jgi:hypothetical protein
VELQHPRPFLLGAVALLHPAGPDTTGGAELGDLLEEVDVAVEEERESRSEIVHLEPAAQTQLHVSEAARHREREFLDRRGSRLTDVVARDR